MANIVVVSERDDLARAHSFLAGHHWLFLGLTWLALSFLCERFFGRSLASTAGLWQSAYMQFKNKELHRVYTDVSDPPPFNEGEERRGILHVMAHHS